MGATTDFRAYPGILTPEQVVKNFQSDQARDGVENGTSYSGSIAMLQGVKVRSETFESRREAQDFIEEHHEKWEPAMAVQYRETHVEPTKTPTFDGKILDSYQFLNLSKGKAKCCAQVGKYGSPKFAVPDQLTEGQRDRFLAKIVSWHGLDGRLQELTREFEELLTKVRQYQQHPEFTTEQWRALKKLRVEIARQDKHTSKALQQVEAFDEKYAAKVWKYKTIDDGVKWLVGGWCAS